MKKLFLTLAIITVVAGLVFGGCAKPAPTPTPTPTPTPEAKTLRIGYLVSLTGWFSQMDAVGFEEAKVLAEIINESGGVTVQGQKYNIELVPEDCKSSFDGVTAATTKLVYDDGVKFICGPSAFFGPAASPVCNQNKIFHVLSFTGCQPGTMGPDFPYTFLGYASPVQAGRAGVAAMKKFNPDAKTITWVTPDDGSEPYLRPFMKEAFAEYGLTMVGDTVLYANEIVDFSPIAAKVNSLKADLILHQPGIPQHMAAIVKGLRELGNFKPYGDLSLRPEQALALCGKEAAANLFADVMVVDNPDNTPIMKELLKRLIEKYGPDAPMVLNEAPTLYVVVEAIKAAQSLDPTAVRDALENATSIDTIFGPGVMGGEKTYGIKNHAVIFPEPMVFIEKDGELKWSGYMKVTVP